MTSLREPPKKPRTSPVPIPGMAAKSKNSSVQIGLVGTILVHVLILLIGPYLLRLEHGGVPVPLEQQSDLFEIELGPELSEEEQLQEPDPFKFVETNPDAPDNAPDSTDAFSDRNQQVAQEEESEDMSGDRPVLEGQTKIESSLANSRPSFLLHPALRKSRKKIRQMPSKNPPKPNLSKSRSPDLKMMLVRSLMASALRPRNWPKEVP